MIVIIIIIMIFIMIMIIFGVLEIKHEKKAF